MQRTTQESVLGNRELRLVEKHRETDDVVFFSFAAREGGLVSSWMYNQHSEGEIILAGTPQGDFCLRPPSDGPAFLIGAGVGITPLVSMLHELAEAGSGRQVRFIYATTDAVHQPLRSELEGLLAKLFYGHLHSAYS